MGHVKGAIQVDDPVAEDLVLQDGNTPDTALLGGNPLHSAGDVGSLEPGQCGKGLRCFGLCLEGLQSGRLVADFVAVLFRQGHLQLRHPLPELRLLLLHADLARLHDGGKAVRVFQEPAPDHFLEESGLLFQAAPDTLDEGVELQGNQGIPVVEPGMEGAAHKGDPVGVAAADDLLAVEFHLVQGRLDEVPFESLPRQTLQSFKDQILNGPGLFGVRAAKSHGKDDLPQIGLEPRNGREVFTQARVDEGLAKGACCRADQGVGGNAEQQHLLGVRIFRHHPGQVHGRLAGKALLLSHGVAIAHRTRLRPPGLEPDGRIDRHLAESAQDVLQEGQVILRRDAAVEEEIGIRGGIVEPVELPELLPGEPGDDLRGRRRNRTRRGCRGRDSAGAPCT